MKQATKEVTMKGLSVLSTVLALAALGAVAGCGGEERLSREEFDDRLETIDREGSALYGRLAQGAAELEPGEPLPAGVEQALAALVEFQEEAAAELEGLNPPEEAEAASELLVEALRERTVTFEQAIEAGRLTPQTFDQVAQAGEKIDRAFAELRKEGFLAAGDDHDEE